MMTQSDIYWTFQTAIHSGGSFYARLAGAGLVADPFNRDRLLAAFPEMAETYGPASQLHRDVRSN
jgi:hypothetical protein